MIQTFFVPEDGRRRDVYFVTTIALYRTVISVRRG